MNSGMKTKALLRDKAIEKEEKVKMEASRRSSTNIRDGNEVVDRLYRHKKVYDVRKEEEKEKQYKEVLFKVI